MRVMDVASIQQAAGVEIQMVVPLPLEQAVQRFNYIKVLLWYETEHPQTSASLVLKTPPFDMPGPVLEYIAILKPAEKTFDILWAFLEDFETLKDMDVVPKDAKLGSFDFIEEDKRFMAWVV
jgi:hypothetical protein